MIRLLGVLSEGGVPVVIRSYVETESEMIIGALISAAKTLCDAMGSGEVKQLAFKDNTLIVTESKKCYTIVALVTKAEDYMDTLFRIIADELDDSEIPPADGIVSDIHISITNNVLDTYIRDKLNISLSDIVAFSWNPILDAIRNDPQLDAMIRVLENRLNNADLRPRWKALVEKTSTSLDEGLVFALHGEYDRACAASLGIEDDMARIFTIKMGQLARSMSSTSAPLIEDLKQVAMRIKGDDPYCRLGRAIVGFLSGEISGAEYTEAFRSAAEAFDFGQSERTLLYSFLFIDVRISLLHEFANRFADHLRDTSPIARAYIFSILDRDAIFEKLYSVSSYDDFKETIGFYKSRIDGILEQIRQVLKKGLVHRLRKSEGMRGLALRASLQLQNYITLLTALSESPVLTISERKEVLTEVIELYFYYFRRLIHDDLPIFEHTIDSIFQSLGVANAEYYYLATGSERERHLEKIGTFLQDIIDISGREWAKSRVRFSIYVVLNALGPVLTRAQVFREEAAILHYLAMKTTDIEAIEESRETVPDMYATNTGNILTSLASLSYNLLSENIRNSVFTECVLRSLEVQEWFVSHGMVCRDDIMAVTYHASSAAEMLSEWDLQKVVKIVIALNRVAVQNPQKYDYEVAVTGSSLIGVLSKSWERLGNPKYFEQASRLLRLSASSWRKYGFYEKADNLEKLYSHLLT